MGVAMSTLAPPIGRERSVSLRVGAWTDALAVSGLVLMSALMVVLTWNTWGDPSSDTGYDLVAGARLADGELPYRDYLYYYGPLAPAVVAAAFVVGGSGIGSSVALGLTLAIAIVALTYVLARMLSGSLGAFLAAAITAPVAFAPSNFSFVIPHSYSATLGILGTLVFLLGIARYAVAGRAAWLVAAGTSAGLVALTRPEFVAAVAVAGALWLTLQARVRSNARRELLLLALPALAIPLAVYGALLAVVSPRRLVLENLYPVDTLEAGGNAILSLHAPLTFSSFAELGLKLVLYAAGAGALLLLARGLEPGRRMRRLALGATVIGAGAVALASLTRPETLRYGLEFAYGWIPAGAAVGAIVLVWRLIRRRVWTPKAQLQLAAVAVLTVLAAKTYAAFLVHASVPQIAAYAVPFAALFLVSLHLDVLARTRVALGLGAVWLAFLAAAGAGLTWKDARAESEAIAGPGGTLAATPEQAPAYDAALAWLVDNTAPGERVLAAPQLTWMYTLAEREAPLEQLSLHPGALPTVDDERSAIERLETAGVRVVILDRRSFPEYGQSSFGNSFNRTLAGWIRGSFTRVATFGSGAPGSPALEGWLRRNA